MKPLIAPSVLAADFGNLERDCKMINDSEADWFHIDVMDGVFVPNISFGMPVLKSIANHAKKPLDVHLMIVEPERYIETFAALGSEILTVHYEASNHLHRTLQSIKSHGMKAGVALNPHTPVKLLKSIINDVDLICIMSVNPGFGGQSFIHSSLEKIAQVRKMIDDYGKDIRLEVDGGINKDTIGLASEAGADTFVAGSAIFNTENYEQTISELRSKIV